MDIDEEQLVRASISMYYLLQPAAFAAEEDAMQRHFEKSQKAYEQVEASSDKAEKLFLEAMKTPDFKKRMCAALEKWEESTNQVAKLIINGVGVGLLINTAVDISVSPQAIVAAVMVIVFKMGIGFFCVET